MATSQASSEKGLARGAAYDKLEVMPAFTETPDDAA